MTRNQMKRTQIYLRPDQEEILDRASKESGVPMAQLIREAIDESFAPHLGKERRRKAITDSQGLWARRRFDGPSYVSAVRHGPEWSRELHQAAVDAAGDLAGER